MEVRGARVVRGPGARRGGGSDAALAAFAPRVHASGEGAHVQATNALAPDYLDKLLAPVALYPDQLLAQMLLCAGDARKVGELSAWLKQTKLTGSELQQAAQKAGFEPSFVALALFPQVVELMSRRDRRRWRNCSRPRTTLRPRAPRTTTRRSTRILPALERC